MDSVEQQIPIISMLPQVWQESIISFRSIIVNIDPFPLLDWIQNFILAVKNSSVLDGKYEDYYRVWSRAI